MVERNQTIRRLEMRIEQLIIHVRSLPRQSADAAEARRILFVMLLRLEHHKWEREREEDAILLREVA
jgi:hypothetical protein